MTTDKTPGSQLPSCDIIPANHGGFVVMVGNQPGSMSAARSFSFAGSLDDCLSFVRRILTPELVIK